MKWKKTLPLLFAIIVLQAHAEEKNKATAELRTVTVYTSGAEMNHTAIANIKNGSSELTIENISNDIDINSIQIKAPASITILGVEFSNNYLMPAEKSANIILLEDSLKKIQQDYNKLNIVINNTTELLEVLKANQNIKGEQAGLSVAELAKLMDYYESKSLELRNKILQLADKENMYADLMNRLKNQIDEEQKKNTATKGRLILQLNAAMASKAEFNISYIARNAYWKPFYDIKAEKMDMPLKMVYKAKIVQTTGLDWKQVKLSLSTSLPTQWGNAPVLQSWFLGYIDPIAAMNNNLKIRGLASNQAQPFASLQGRAAGVALDEVVVTGYYSTQHDSTIPDYKYTATKPIYVVNGAVMSESSFQQINPNAIKKMETFKSKAATAMYGSSAQGGAIVVTLKEGLEDYISVSSNTLNLSYDLDTPYDILSNGKEQTAILKTTDVPVFYKHYSVPKLDKDAYLLAEVPSWEKLNLLPGEANIIFEGTYVGKSFIDPNSTQDTLNLTLGRDKRVVIKREKLADFSSVKFLGNNKLQKFTYQITVKNNKTETVHVLLKDQFPLTTNKDIETELLETNDAGINNDIGVLNWPITLAPGEQKIIRYSYSIKYPKDKVLNLQD